MDIRMLPLPAFKRYKKEKEENIKLLREDQREERSLMRGYPNYINMITDESCNFRCSMCIQQVRWAAGRGPEVIDEKYLVKFAREVFPTALVMQLNTAGEPLVSRVLDLELSLAEEYGLKLDLFTNGYYFDLKHKRLRNLLKNILLATFSVDSPVKKTYESIRKGGDFDRLVKNMRAFHAYRKRLPLHQRPYFSINMVVMKKNLNELSRMVRFAKDIGADEVVLSRMLVHNDSMHNESLDDVKIEANLAMMGALFLAHRLGIRIATSSLFPVQKSKKGDSSLARREQPQTERTCSFLWSSVYLDSNACVIPCCAPSHPVIGSMRDSDLKSLWNSPMYQSMRSTFTGGLGHPVCRECRKTGLLSTLDC